MTENKLPIFFRYRFLWHLLFWFVVFFIYWLNAAGFKGRYHQELLMNLYLLPVRMLATYSLVYLILPLATLRKEFVLFGIIVSMHALLYGFLIYATYYFVNPFPDFYDFTKQPLFNPAKILTKAVSDYVIPVIAAAIVIFKKWYSDEQNNKKLAEEKMKAELNFLKSQVHPHFLFNTLNNLYALTLIKSDKTPDIVLKLSDLLDFMIYKSNDDYVPLAKELEIVEGYIELEKVRYSDRLDLRYRVTGETTNRQIAPLILLPFVENCFKHGASKDRSNPVIHIQINIEPECLCLKAVNSVPAESKTVEDENNGIGLSNVRRRLELIYPDRHALEIRQDDKTFEVELKIYWKT